MAALLVKADQDALIQPESVGLDSQKLQILWTSLQDRGTKAFLVVRHDQLVFEGYALDHTPTTPHYTASLAKALVGGLSLMLAIEDQRIDPDEAVRRFVPDWANDPRRRLITIRHLATHTAGIEDAEQDDLPHEKLSGWKGEFWKRLPPPRDPFSLARDVAPVLDGPGTRARYSNPGIAMLSYCITSSLQGAPSEDLRALLTHRILEPLGVPRREWSIGYGSQTRLDNLNVVAAWGGGSFSPEATARIGRLLLHKGVWEGRQVLSPGTVEMATKHAGMPNNSGLGWWVNRELDGSKRWKAAPPDAFWGAGAGHQFLLVIPSLDLVVVRYGAVLDPSLPFDRALENHVVEPIIHSFLPRDPAVHPPSPVVKQITWAPKAETIRAAKGSDNWPSTWGDDDCLYTGYGDGQGFTPFVPRKLSLGFAKVLGSPPDLGGVNVRSATGEQLGEGKHGRKASGLLMVDGVLYLWARNTTNSQLAWSKDHAQTWTWSSWKFTNSFGCPTFLNFGKNYSGARDDFIYVYSPDTDDAYSPSDRFVLARVAQKEITQSEAYQFFERTDLEGRPVWTRDIQRRGAVFERKGQCYRSSVSYNPGLRRYFWCQTLPGPDARFGGGFAIYDAPEPWGPWTEVFYTEQWDTPPGETSSFPTKWMSSDGATMWLLFSGEDSFSIRRATIAIHR